MLIIFASDLGIPEESVVRIGIRRLKMTVASETPWIFPIARPRSDRSDSRAFAKHTNKRPISWEHGGVATVNCLKSAPQRDYEFGKN
jgi:hypothetical protein